MLDLLIAFILFLCWGSFLNVVGFRLVREQSLLGRSRCGACQSQLAWYDLIPVISWVALQGRCRTCSIKISLLYPAIELLTAIACTLLILLIPEYRLGYFIFFSALIVTIRTDFETMLISRYMTLGLVPIALMLSFFHALPIRSFESIIGAIFGYALLWIIARLFQAMRHREGLGQGDLDLLGMIGAFTGLFGAWIALFIGAFCGSLVGLVIVLKNKRSDIKIPFGPWLTLGAILYVFLQNYISFAF